MSNILLDRATIIVTGAANVGKTVLATTYALPDDVGRVFYHDSERSANRVVQEMDRLDVSLGYYGDLESRFSDLPSTNDLLNRLDKGELPWVGDKQRSSLESYYEYVINDLNDNLSRGKFDVYVHDTIEKLEAGMAAWVQSHKGVKKGQAGWTTQAYGRMWSDGVYPLYEGIIEAVFARGVKTIILVSHLKTPWLGEGKNARPIPGKVAPGGKIRLLKKLSSLMLWLVQDPANADGAPGAIVIKERTGTRHIIEVNGRRQWKERRRIPRRIPKCVWWSEGKDRDSIEWYLEHGCDLGNPTPREVMTKDEKQMLSEFMTDEQVRLMILEAEMQLEEAKAVNGHRQEVEIAQVVRPLDPKVEELMGKAVEAGLNEGNKVEVKDKLLSSIPPPIRASMDPKVDEAIERVLSGNLGND